MMLKSVVGWSLAIVIFAIGTIIMIGALPSALFPACFFLFIFLLLLAIILLNKDAFGSRLVFIVIIALLYALFLTIPLSSLKSYQATTESITQEEQRKQEEIAQMEQNIAYSQAYIDYFNAEIKQLQNAEQSLMDQLITLRSTPAAEPAASAISPTPLLDALPTQESQTPEQREESRRENEEEDDE